MVDGAVTPDTFSVDGQGTVTAAIGEKQTRFVRVGSTMTTARNSADKQKHLSLPERAAARLASLGMDVADLLGGPQDIEWAVVDGEIWLLQARPITAKVPAAPARQHGFRASTVFVGTPGSQGVAVGPARIVQGPDDFGRVEPGDILACPYTDPSWTVLLGIVSGVVTETGGALSHAAIVARERGIPAVLSVADATTVMADGAMFEVNGTDGTVSPQ